MRNSSNLQCKAGVQKLACLPAAVQSLPHAFARTLHLARQLSCWKWAFSGLQKMSRITIKSLSHIYCFDCMLVAASNLLSQGSLSRQIQNDCKCCYTHSTKSPAYLLCTRLPLSVAWVMRRLAISTVRMHEVFSFQFFPILFMPRA
jgi:hypothetical protein